MPTVPLGARLGRVLGNVTVLQVTIPLPGAAGVNASSLLASAHVSDIFSTSFVVHLAKAAQLVPGNLLAVGVGRCSPLNFIPAGADFNAYQRATPSATPLRVPFTAPTAQLSGSPPALCMTLEYVEDVPRTGVSALHVLYRLAVLFGAGVDTTARTGGVDLRPLAVTGVTPGTHLLAPMMNLAPPDGRGFINYTLLAVAGEASGQPSPLPGSPPIPVSGLITSLPGVTPGYLPSTAVVKGEDATPIRNALIAFVVLFLISALACGAYYRWRGFSDRAPRPPTSKPRRGTLGEIVNPLRDLASKGGSSTPKPGVQIRRTAMDIGQLTSPGPSSSSSTAPSLFTSAPTPVAKSAV